MFHEVFLSQVSLHDLIVSNLGTQSIDFRLERTLANLLPLLGSLQRLHLGLLVLQVRLDCAEVGAGVLYVGAASRWADGLLCLVDTWGECRFLSPHSLIELLPRKMLRTHMVFPVQKEAHESQVYLHHLLVCQLEWLWVPHQFRNGI